ncbi:DNA starvation/stationary phase protection protein [Streptomyces sp. A7024]|uniref:DNA starvation/stationary phase protection protein n=1 Tax=Streptomyces coryli TaxID=1128680 RepID=A0A6G4UCM2_9ACTN|nr:DNA starvation/stationary phase protection protein [Streptomyces coryli]NGN69985.1 DNA starvation/stationary phase protection protein [Streptomyces coryli]
MRTTILEGKDLDVTGDALQSALVDLLDLSLQAKQAHWNVSGPLFRELHLQLDEVVELAREHADTVAERAAALGQAPDGRASTLSGSRQGPDVGPGELSDQKVIDDFSDLLGQTAARMRERIADTETADPVSQDLFIGITGDLEKQAWFFRSHRIGGRG